MKKNEKPAILINAMTSMKNDLLKAKVASALYYENGRVPTSEEIEKWTKIAKILYTTVLGVHFERQRQKERGELVLF